MAEALSIEDRERAEQIYSTVEAQLKIRYSWIGLITAALIGGGAYTIITGITSSTQETLLQARLVMESVNTELAKLRGRSNEMNEDLESRRNEVENLKQQIDLLQQQELATIKQFTKMRDSVANSLDLLKEATVTVQEVVTAVERQTATKLVAANESIASLTRSVDQASEQLLYTEYKVYLHGGGALALGDSFINTVQSALRSKGLIIAGTDEKSDEVGGPGVDFFVEQDRAVAQIVADAVNAVLPDGAPKLRPRLQAKYRNRPGTLGLWL